MIDENTAKISMIPATWEHLAVSEVFDQISTSGKTIKQRDYKTEGKFPIIDQGEAYVGGYTDNPASVIDVEDPLIAFGDHTRKFKFLSHDFVPGADGLKVLKPAPCLLTKFAYFGCLSLRLPDRGYARHYADLRKLRFPVAPIAEQERIVEKIETLFTQLDQGEASLRTVQTLLTRYRQSVLKAAVTGQLTADWRAENAHRLEHGSDLLQRILQTRRDNWQGRGKYKEPAAPDTSDLPQLPEGWVWASAEQLTSSEPNSLCIGPFGSNLKVEDYKDAGVPLIFVRHIRSKNFEGMSPKFVSTLKAEELASHRAFPGDLLITKMGEPPGDVCIYPKDRPMAIITADCIRLAPTSVGLSAEYLELAIASRVVQSQIHSISKGVAQQKVNLANFRKVAIPLPTLEEQLRIADSIKLSFEQAEQCKGQCRAELNRSTALRQSILKDAFAGRLVPQDPNDEPAAELLQRIKADREASPPTSRQRRAKA